MRHLGATVLYTTARLLLLVACVILLTGCPLGGAIIVFPPDSGGSPDDDGENPNGPSATASEIEQQAHDAINTERTSRGLEPLELRGDLVAVARAHSEDMIARGFFSHVNPDGDDPFDRMGDAGVTYNIAGENIAWNNFPDAVATAVEGWMDSQGHRENILRESFTHTGMGVATDGEGAFFFTQVFIGESKSVPEGVIEVYFAR